ncbi:MFS transporter [Salinicola rhizosphaerae]|uniref:MFS transporter n=1 Tax=Salinicola rhizosphaerae TaxID=1443141 RepID=A0ABQ3E0P8_9GAMM|nr:MFS transporter [Salinicola rhizosphaerae]GHB21098.1 MFS transporter [Salinicola rhizosphaerae]
MPPSSHHEATSLSRRLTLLLATGTGLTVASLYYAQPLLGVLAADMQIPAHTAGLIPTLTQLGYALGILLLIPLGDRVDRRWLILAKVAALSVALFATAFAPSLALLLVASFAVGITASAAQDIVPAATLLADDRERGKVVGSVMSGLLLGILLSLVISGLVAQVFGWRAIFGLAAILVALIGVALWRGLPHFTPTTTLRYGQLLTTLYQLWRDHAELRRAAIAQGFLSVAFSAFWATLSIHLFDAFGLGSAIAGTFGLAGAGGVLAAPFAGRLADRIGPHQVTRIGAAITTLAFLAMAAADWLPLAGALTVLALGALLFNFGLQSTLVAHQSLIFGLDPGARGRINAVMFSVVFVGMAAGSALGGAVLGQWGWLGVVALATAVSLIALLIRLADRRAPALTVSE